MDKHPSWQLAGEDYSGPAATIIASAGTGKTEEVLRPAAYDMRDHRGDHLVILDPEDDPERDEQ